MMWMTGEHHAIGRRALDTAKCFGPALRKRNGSDSVSECDAPDCSVSGATTQMSSESVRAIFSATARPGRVDAVVVGDQDAELSSCACGQNL